MFHKLHSSVNQENVANHTSKRIHKANSKYKERNENSLANPLRSHLCLPSLTLSAVHSVYKALKRVEKEDEHRFKLSSLLSSPKLQHHYLA